MTANLVHHQTTRTYTVSQAEVLQLLGLPTEEGLKVLTARAENFYQNEDGSGPIDRGLVIKVGELH